MKDKAIGRAGTGQGKGRRDKTRHHTTHLDKRDTTGEGKRRDEARRGKAKQVERRGDKLRQNKARQDRT